MRQIHCKYARQITRVFIASMFLTTFAVFNTSAQGKKINVFPANEQVTLTWSGSTADSIVVTGASSWKKGESLESPVTVDGLENNKLYAIEIYFHPVEWPIVDVGVVYTIPGEPAAPRNFTATAGYKSARLSWQAPVDGKYYSYEIVNETGEKIYVGDATSYTIGNLTGGQSYLFRVIARQTFDNFPGKDKESWNRATVSGSTDFVSVTPDSEEVEEVKVAAANGNIIINVDEEAEVEIFDSNGQPFLKRKLTPGQNTIPAQKGIYLVKINSYKTKVFVQ